MNSYEIDISIKAGEQVTLMHDNVKEVINALEFINEVQYVNTKISPTLNGYITIGGDANEDLSF